MGDINFAEITEGCIVHNFPTDAIHQGGDERYQYSDLKALSEGYRSVRVIVAVRFDPKEYQRQSDDHPAIAEPCAHAEVDCFVSHQRQCCPHENGEKHASDEAVGSDDFFHTRLFFVSQNNL